MATGSSIHQRPVPGKLNIPLHREFERRTCLSSRPFSATNCLYRHLNQFELFCWLYRQCGYFGGIRFYAMRPMFVLAQFTAKVNNFTPGTLFHGGLDFGAVGTYLGRVSCVRVLHACSFLGCLGAKGLSNRLLRGSWFWAFV